MTVTLDLDAILQRLIETLGASVYFILVSTENGVIVKSYINEEEFNKAAIGLNISQIYELSEDLADSCGLHNPDFNIIHSDSYYILSIKILEKIFILLTEDLVDIKEIFRVINESTLSE